MDSRKNVSLWFQIKSDKTKQNKIQNRFSNTNPILLNEIQRTRIKKN